MIKLNFCSPFYKEQCYFGGYPNKEQYLELVNEKFDLFIDLTTVKERQLLEYNYHNNKEGDEIEYINFSIIDNKVPTNILLFKRFLGYILGKIKEKKKSIFIVEVVMVALPWWLQFFFII